MPGEGQVYRGEVPLLVIPSSTNLSVLEENHFQVDFREPYPTIAKRLVYFFTGIAPEIKPTPMGIGADFINPEDNQKMDFQEYKEMVLKW